MSQNELFGISLQTTTGLAGIDLGMPSVTPPPMVDDDDEDDAAATHGAAEAEQDRGTNYRLTGHRALAKGWKERALANIEAISLSKEIDAARRPATPEEQEILAAYVGFGSTELAQNAFQRPGEDTFREGWEEIGAKLAAVTTEDEYASLARSTQYAHYTPETIVSWVWKLVTALGFQGGRVLEPGMGTGLFLAMMPENLANTTVATGVEYDAATARIARQLFPRSRIRHADFTKLAHPGHFELAVGNPPFSDRTVKNGVAWTSSGLRLHDWFIARSISLLRAGGLAVFVTSNGTLDKANCHARRVIAGMADLVTAVRLPEGTFRATAGTGVSVDVLVFQKRGAAEDAEAAPGDVGTQAVDWLDTTEVPTEDADGTETEGETVSVNSFFAKHPEAVLGRHAITSGPFGPGYSCLPRAGLDLAAELDAVLDRLPAPAPLPATLSETESLEDEMASTLMIGTAAEGARFKEGSYLISDDDHLQQIVNGRPHTLTVAKSSTGMGILAKSARIIRMMIPIRDALREVLTAQVNGDDCRDAQARLRTAYASFTRRNGPINSTVTYIRTDPVTGEEKESHRLPNIEPFRDDPDCWLVASIEHYDIEENRATMGPIFDRIVLTPPEPAVIRTASDALAVCLSERGGVDLGFIAELLEMTEPDAAEALGTTIYRVPGTTMWETADHYLSGKVRSKLAAARAAMEEDPAFARNVEALEKVQPKDLAPSDITARLGAPWIPTDVVETFVADVIGSRGKVTHTKEVASWSVKAPGLRNSAAGTSTWGTKRRTAEVLLEDALNNRTPAIYDEDPSTKQKVLNPRETEAAKEKLQAIKDAFTQWVWTDANRGVRLCRIYNDGYNDLVARHFDGSHLTLPGASNAIILRPIQKRAVWRIIASGDTYLAHAVGAGKTFTMAAAIMEQRRLNLINTAVLVVPGNRLAPTSTELLQLYPLARVLVADEENFTSDKRHRFIARATTEHWDVIIITHSAFKLLPVPRAFERDMVLEEMRLYERIMTEVDSDDRVTTKRLERLKEGLQEKLESLTKHRDDMVTIEEMGIDQILYDEAQVVRKLAFATNQVGLKGITAEGSQIAWDIYVKRTFLAGKRPNRALVFASGTPITNTMGELYTLKRFLCYDALKERGIHEFDAWCSNFCDTKTELELQPSGKYKPITRLSTFVNVAEMTAIFREIADVVLKEELRQHVKLPTITTGRRQIITVEPTDAFVAYRELLADRIAEIEARTGAPEKGDDIILTVITDGRHAAIDLRLVEAWNENEPDNKLNTMIRHVYEIWKRTGDLTYRRPDGEPYPIPGGSQMIFSDLGTLSVAASRGFSAYRWIKQELVRLGIPEDEIAIAQDYKKSKAKERLAADINAGRKRIAIGSTPTMGTGTNAQTRIVALHHLDVPWLPSEIEQREGRIERQGNQNGEVGIFAYATKGSMDATMWQQAERKQRFIEAAMKGDPSMRRLEEDEDSAANQFAIAKALASGDDRLIKRAGLENEINKLLRQRSAHMDDQFAVRRTINDLEERIKRLEKAIPDTEADIVRRRPTKGDLFEMIVNGRTHNDRRRAGAAVKAILRNIEADDQPGTWIVGEIGGFEVHAVAERYFGPLLTQRWSGALFLKRTGGSMRIRHEADTADLSVSLRLEHALEDLEKDLVHLKADKDEAIKRLNDFQPRLGQPFPYAAILEEKIEELKALEDSLAGRDKKNKGSEETEDPAADTEPAADDAAPQPPAEVAEAA